VLLDEPTKGVDVGAKEEIYGIINRLAESGVGILLASSEMPELIGLSDRIVIMRDGTTVAELAAEEANEEAILRSAIGG
jgi:ribose transport system ATP-binding protein